MTLDQIRNILHGTTPFTIRMVNGREYHVEHPDFVALTRDFTTLVLTDEKKLFELIRLDQIESINVVNELAA
ncbi:MAG TPA: hypothetical protein VG734_15200 [Lacunisphaera sp.]|nr:hypothetical protein [Lacunisphaera sp.]